MGCPFCELKDSTNEIVTENSFAYAIWDANPVTNGHALVIPKEHIVSFFEIDESQVSQLFSLSKDMKAIIDQKYIPDGYNLAVNDGEAAGRTVHHVHLHIIPRYKGDVENPRGGVRHIIPGKGDY